MKKRISIPFLIVLLFGLVSCQNVQKEQSASGASDIYEGYLTIKGNQLFVNDFEFIDLSDRYWINQLELTTEDMPNGYYIYDVSDEWMTFSLNDETRYNFYDIEAQFVSEGDIDRLYTTTNLDDFLTKFDIDDNGDLGKIPFRIQVLEDGKVLSISEIFIN